MKCSHLLILLTTVEGWDEEGWSLKTEKGLVLIFDQDDRQVNFFTSTERVSPSSSPRSRVASSLPHLRLMPNS